MEPTALRCKHVNTLEIPLSSCSPRFLFTLVLYSSRTEVSVLDETRQ
jgi:hypothetical protein